MRLIDADAVEYSIWREWLCSKTTKEKELCDILEKIIDRCCEHIDNAPTIDAEPARHGHWIICSDGYYPYCSKCKQEPGGKNMTNYCPHCGAKMDEKAVTSDE